MQIGIAGLGRMGAAVVALAVPVLEEVHDDEIALARPAPNPVRHHARNARDGDFCAAAS